MKQRNKNIHREIIIHINKFTHTNICIYTYPDKQENTHSNTSKSKYTLIYICAQTDKKDTYIDAHRHIGWEIRKKRNCKYKPIKFMYPQACILLYLYQYIYIYVFVHKYLCTHRQSDTASYKY